MLRLKADNLIAIALMGFSVYLMIHATVLPIWWVEGQGPGGGAFPFWLSLIMFLASAGVFMKSRVMASRIQPFFDPDMRASVAQVVVALTITIALIPIAGSYIALPLLMIWYLRFFGGRTWLMTMTITVSMVLVLFFFFEVTLKILLPKGFTEPLFLPLYAFFF